MEIARLLYVLSSNLLFPFLRDIILNLLIYSQILLGSMIAEGNALFLMCYWKHQVLILINNVMKTIVLR